MIMYIIIGIISGILSGMGIGGGTLLIPFLVIVYGQSQQVAQNVNLLYFIPTALIAIFVHKKNSNIEFKIAKTIIVFGIFGAIGGAFLAMNLDQEILRKIFGFFLLIMGLVEFFKKDKKIDLNEI